MSEGEWQAKVLVTNKKTGKSNTLTLDMLAREPSQLRMDVTSTLGVYLASIVLDNDQIEYLLARERKFYSGPASAEAMKQLISIPLDPRLVHKILFDSPIAASDQEWTCTRDQQERPLRCEHRSSSLSVEWKSREDDARVIAFSAPQADLTMSVRLIQAKVQSNEKTFDLEPPRGFKIMKSASQP